MKDKKFKRITSILLVVSLIILLRSNTTFAICEKGDYIDCRKASLIALVMIENIRQSEELVKWTEGTSISSFTQLVDNNGNLIAYGFNLQDMNKSVGYIITAAWTGLPIVLEYSDNNEAPYDKGNTVFCGGWIYVDEGSIAEGDVLSYCYSEENINNNRTLISMIDRIESLYLDNQQNSLLSSDFPITNPVSYLTSLYGNLNYYVVYSTMISGFNGYLMTENMSCTVDAMAAIISFNSVSITGSYKSRTTVFNDARAIGLSNGYYTVSGGTGLFQEAPFTNAVLAYYSSSWVASTHLSGVGLGYAQTEIFNNRPVMFNIAFTPSYYYNHTVTAFGHVTYADSNGDGYVFFAIKDGYNTGTRYFPVTGLEDLTVTGIKP